MGSETVNDADNALLTSIGEESAEQLPVLDLSSVGTSQKDLKTNFDTVSEVKLRFSRRESSD